MARVLALLVALSGAFAAPISALTHGHAHQHEAAAYEHAPHEAAIAEHSDHGSGEHAHALIGAALTSKVATPLVALVVPRMTLPLTTVVLSAPPVAEAAGEHRTQLAQAPPPRLRAPPA